MNIQQMIDGERDNTQVDGDEEDGPVDVELSNEDLSTSESTADEEAAKRQAEAEKKKQNRVPADKRIGKLTREKHEALELADRIKNELLAEREKSAKLEQAKSLADRAAFVHYADKVDANLDKAKRAYSEAMTSGDPDKITEAQMELTKWGSEKTEVERYKARQPKEVAEPDREQRETRQPVQEERQTRQPETLAPEAKRWTQETGWFNPESDTFNPEMHAEAVAYAQVVERKLMRQGRADEIGKSEAYFKEIEAHIQNEFPDEFDAVVDLDRQSPAARTPAMEGGRPDVAPANRVNGGGAISNTPSTKVTLTADDKDMVRRYMTAGIIKDPKTGQPVKDFARAQYIYGLQKWKTQQEDARRQN